MVRTVVTLKVTPSGTSAVALLRAGIHAGVHAGDLDAADILRLIAAVVDTAVLPELLRGIGFRRVQRVVGLGAGDV